MADLFSCRRGSNTIRVDDRYRERQGVPRPRWGGRGVKNMSKGILRAAPAVAVVLGLAAAAPPSRAAPGPDGAALYAQRCAQCHDHAAGHVPSREALANRPASNIVMTLLTGAMRPQASGMSRGDAAAVAAFVTAGAAANAARLHPNPCRGSLAPLRLTGAGWNGWGRDLANTRFQPDAGLAADDV